MEKLLKETREISEAFKATLENLDTKRNNTNLQDQALMMLSTRQIKFCDAFLILSEAGFGEPSAVILRVIYETYVLMRWVLTKPERAEKYFKFSDAESARIFERMVSNELIKPSDTRTPAITQEIIKRSVELKKNKPRSFEEMAKDSGLSKFHAMVYGLLSSFAHGNMIAFGLSKSEKSVSFEPKKDNVNHWVWLTREIVFLSLKLYEIWMTNKEISPAPEIPVFSYSILKRLKQEA